MEPEPGTTAVGRAPGAASESLDETAQDTSVATLAALVTRLDRACEELFAVTPYAGDQSTGSTLDGCVDEIVGALRTLRADADDLRRVIEISRLRRSGGR